jgi:hypothetical protein
MNYENTPTSTGSTPAQWPVDSQVAHHAGQPTLLMFLHPYCPCSRASVEELNRLLVQCRDSVSINVLFVRPRGVSNDWTDTGLRKVAESIPGVHVALDSDGREASRFGAKSSGYVVLYNPKGNLVFSGGITGSRGHSGDNAGEDAVVSLVNGSDVPLKHTDVYGCDLFDRAENTNK